MRAPSSKTERNTAKFSDTLRTPSFQAAAHSSASMNSMTPLGAPRSRRIRSRETPSLPQGTKDWMASSRPSWSRAMEKPRSVSVSRQASVRSTSCRISSSDRVGWRRTRQVTPVVEVEDVQDGLVAELERAEPGADEGPGASSEAPTTAGTQAWRRATSCQAAIACGQASRSPTGSPPARHTPASTR